MKKFAMAAVAGNPLAADRHNPGRKAPSSAQKERERGPAVYEQLDLFGDIFGTHPPRNDVEEVNDSDLNRGGDRRKCLTSPIRIPPNRLAEDAAEPCAWQTRGPVRAGLGIE